MVKKGNSNELKISTVDITDSSVMMKQGNLYLSSN